MNHARLVPKQPDFNFGSIFPSGVAFKSLCCRARADENDLPLTEALVISSGGNAANLRCNAGGISFIKNFYALLQDFCAKNDKWRRRERLIRRNTKGLIRRAGCSHTSEATNWSHRECELQPHGEGITHRIKTINAVIVGRKIQPNPAGLKL